MNKEDMQQLCDLCLDWNFADCDNCDLKREAAEQNDNERMAEQGKKH